jgi:hypothetical protein
MMRHNVKCWSKYFDDVKSGKKSFEVRLNDRNYQVGDILRQSNYDPEIKEFVGEFVDCRITYILDDHMFCKPGYVVMGINVMGYGREPIERGD